MEGQVLHLIAYKGQVEILTDARYQERKVRGTPENTAGNLKTMKKAGLR
jgi:hypothetical protein